MTDEIDYKSNPLHGLGLKAMLTELVDHYGFAILFSYLNINCFKTNPSIASSVKFLKKTDWAREKVEDFYLYQFKSLPAASYEQSLISPRSRVIPEGQSPGEPMSLSVEDGAKLQEQRVKKAAEYDRDRSRRRSPAKPSGVYGKRPAGQKQPNTRRAKADTADSSEGVAFNPWTKPKKS